MTSNPLLNKPEERRLLKLRATQIAFDHFDGFDSRTGLILLRNRLLNEQPSVSEDSYVIEVLSDLVHRDRLPVCPGPVVAHYTKDDKREALVVEVAPLLLSRDRSARIAAFNHFRAIIKPCGHIKPERLESVFEQNKEALFSEELEHWSESAVKLFDVIADDFFINLAGVKQCIELNYEIGLNQFLPKVIEPSMPSVEWIELPIPIPSKQHSDITEIISNAVLAANSIEEACSIYFQQLGAMPLARPFSMAELLNKWIAAKRDTQNLWDRMWTWADRTQTPLARYHAIQLFCGHPAFIPRNSFRAFWNEVDQVVMSSISKPQDTRWSQEMLFRCELAQHYSKYFESRRPERNSEAIAKFAWWLSETVALAFSNRAKVIEGIRSSVLKNAQIRANYPWQMTSPSLEPSSLRLATVLTGSPWSLALECELSNNLATLNYAEVDPQLRTRFEQAVGESLSRWFFPAPEEEFTATFAFETKIDADSVAGTIENDLQAKSFQALIAMRRSVEKTDDLLRRLPTLVTLDSSNQALTGYSLRCHAYFGTISTEELWKLIADENWSREFFLTLDSAVLQLLFEGLNLVQGGGGDLWRCNLPQVLAQSAELAHGNTERQKILFLFTIISSITGDTVSGIERLLKGRFRNDFAEEVKFWRTQFNRIMQLSPPWAAARIRPIIGSLSLT